MAHPVFPLIIKSFLTLFHNQTRPHCSENSLLERKIKGKESKNEGKEGEREWSMRLNAGWVTGNYVSDYISQPYFSYGGKDN